MNLFKNRIQSQGAENDRVVQFIATQIIRWQTRVSNRINHWINGYSRKRQRIILILFGVLMTCALVISVSSNTWRVPLHTKGNYMPRHIGEPSERIGLKDPTHKTTDSITHKK